MKQVKTTEDCMSNDSEEHADHSVVYGQSDYMTAKSGIKHDDADNRGPPKNIILVGTKLDKVRADPNERKVSFQEALDLAKKLNLFSVIETSAKETSRLDMMEDLNDVFSMCALNCYDTSVEKQKAKLGDSPSKKSAQGSSQKTFFFGGKTGMTGNRAKNHSEFDMNQDNNSILNAQTEFRYSFAPTSIDQ
jgi:hypothetical protein